MQRYDPAALRPEEIRAPVLVLHGDADRNTPWPSARTSRAGSRARGLEIVPGGSHMLPATHVERLAESIHGFLVQEPR